MLVCLAFECELGRRQLDYFFCRQCLGERFELQRGGNIHACTACGSAVEARRREICRPASCLSRRSISSIFFRISMDDVCGEDCVLFHFLACANSRIIFSGNVGMAKGDFSSDGRNFRRSAFPALAHEFTLLACYTRIFQRV